jgi:hypothetical protein
MSMNVYITASRKITFKKKNGQRGGGIQTVKFDAWQTPTNVTYEIVKSADPQQAYTNWILTERSQDEDVLIYAEDDIFGEYVPVGRKTYNPGKEHVEKFREWVQEVEEEGYTVKFEVM